MFLVAFLFGANCPLCQTYAHHVSASKYFPFWRYGPVVIRDVLYNCNMIAYALLWDFPGQGKNDQNVIIL